MLGDLADRKGRLTLQVEFGGVVRDFSCIFDSRRKLRGSTCTPAAAWPFFNASRSVGMLTPKCLARATMANSWGPQPRAGIPPGHELRPACGLGELQLLLPNKSVCKARKSPGIQCANVVPAVRLPGRQAWTPCRVRRRETTLAKGGGSGSIDAGCCMS